MNKKIMMAVLATLMAGAGVDAFASACVANASITGTGSVPGGNTCNGTDQLVNTCGDTTSIGNAKDFIYSVSLGATNSATFTVTSPGAAGANTGFNPYVALMSGAACNSLDSCNTGGAENQGNSGAGVAVGPSGNAPAGTYFLVITDAGAAANCGPFNLVVTGTLPVELKNFSVE